MSWKWSKKFPHWDFDPSDMKILIYSSLQFGNLANTLTQTRTKANATISIRKRFETITTNPHPMESFNTVHKSYNRALPNQMIDYQHLILEHKLYN